MFRAALPADAPELSRIAVAAKRHWGYPEAWIELWRRELTVAPEDIERDWYSIAEVSGQAVGFVSVSVDGRNAEIGHLWVLPGFMERGIGRSLLEQALHWSSSRALTSLRVVADPHALDFYLTAGAELIGQQPSIPAPRELPVVRFSIPGSVSV